MSASASQAPFSAQSIRVYEPWGFLGACYTLGMWAEVPAMRRNEATDGQWAGEADIVSGQ